MALHLFPIALGYIVASLALVTEHIVLWEQPWRIEAPWNYVMGVLTILLGYGVWALALGTPIPPDEAWVAAALIASSGKWIVAAYWLRGRAQRKVDEARANGQRQGEIVGGAKGLIADLLEGDADGTHHSRRHN